MNIETRDNVTKVTIMEPSFNVSRESVDKCANIAKFNAMNKDLFNNCCNVSCSICNKSVSKCISNGSYEASTMLVDAFPSEYETFTGAFTDEKGYLITDALKNINIKRSDIYMTTIIKCHNVQDTNENIIKNCISNYFLREIELVQPKRIIFTYSAFQACLKYQIIPLVGTINYFTKTRIKVYNYEMDMYVIYDMNNLNEQQREAFKQGISIFLQ